MNTNQAIGVGVLVIGLILLSTGAGIWIAKPSQSQTALLQTTQYTVKKGDFISIGIPLSGGDTIQGTFKQINGSTVNFYFMNSTQQNVFGNCQPCSSPALLNASNPSSYSYNQKVSLAGTYYLILDNSNGNKAVVVSASAMLGNGGVNNQSILTALISLGIVLVIIGGLLAAMGRRKSGQAMAGSKKVETKNEEPRPSDLKQPTSG